MRRQISGLHHGVTPWALVAWGIRAVITTSCADIFKGNALKNGLLPIVVDPERHAQLFELVARDPSVELTVDLASELSRDGIRAPEPGPAYEARNAAYVRQRDG